MLGYACNSHKRQTQLEIWYDWSTLEAKHILSLPYLNSLYIDTNMKGGVLFENKLHCESDNRKHKSESLVTATASEWEGDMLSSGSKTLGREKWMVPGPL